MHAICIKINENPSFPFFCCKQEIHTEKHFKALPTHRYETKRLHRNNCIPSHCFPNTGTQKLCTKEFTLSQRIQVGKILWWNRIHNRRLGAVWDKGYSRLL